MTITDTIPKYSKAFWLDLLDRAVATAAQALLGVITATAFDLIHIDIVGSVSIVGTATLVAVLKAFAVERKQAVQTAVITDLSRS